MPRVIKFRVWDKSMSRMHVCGDNSHDSMTFDLENKTEYYNLQNGEGSGPGSCYELMQWTGLKDKNGTDIYEGDIIQYDNEKYEVYWSEDWAMFTIRGCQVQALMRYAENSEVIGNVHEVA